MYDDKTQVLVVVGGALTGLSSAVFLATHEVPCVVVVERHPDLLIYILSAARHQPAHGRAVSPGRIGARHPRAASYVSSDRYAFAPIHAKTLADEEYIRRNRRGGRYNSSDPDPVASPSAFGAIDQDKLEILLRDRARELGAVTYGLMQS
jgi:putative polyketide hydroxylase